MTTYRITPYIHYDGNWAWWALRRSDLGGTTPDFAIAKANHYSMVAGEWLCCWATQMDTDTWHAFDNVSIGASDLTFSNNSAFPASDWIYVAALPMYPFSRVQRKMRAWLADTHASDTASSSGGIIGYATARAVGDGSGRTAPALPFYGFKLTGSRVGSKNKAILSALSHATETPGGYQLEGALDWLLGGSASANTLLDYFEFYVYPCTNPQGVWSGWFRSSPEQPAISHDWNWHTTGEESIDAFKAAMNADTGGAIHVGLDFHSFMSNTDIMAYAHTGDTTGNYAYFTTEMQALDPDFNLATSDLSQACLYFYKTLGASLALAVEQGGETTRGVAEWKAYGAQSMQALYEMLIDGRFSYGP